MWSNNASVQEIRRDLDRARENREAVSREVSQLEGEVRRAEDMARSGSIEAQQIQSDLRTAESQSSRDPNKIIQIGTRLRHTEMETCRLWDSKHGKDRKLEDARRRLQTFSQEVSSLCSKLTQAEQEEANQARSRASGSPWSRSSS